MFGDIVAILAIVIYLAVWVRGIQIAFTKGDDVVARAGRKGIKFVKSKVNGERE